MRLRLRLAALGALALCGADFPPPGMPPPGVPQPGGFPPPPGASWVTRILSTGPHPVVELRAGEGDVEIVPGDDGVVAVTTHEGAAAVSEQRGTDAQTFYLTTQRQIGGRIQQVARVVVLPKLGDDQMLVRIAVNRGGVKLRVPASTAALIVNQTAGDLAIRGLHTRAIVRSFGSLSVAASRLVGDSYLQVMGACDLRDVSGDDLSVALLGGPGRARNVRARTLEVSGQGASIDWELAAKRGDTQNFAIAGGDLLLRVPASAQASIVANSTAGSLGGILQVSAAPFGLALTGSGTFHGGGANVAITAEASSVDVVRSKS